MKVKTNNSLQYLEDEDDEEEKEDLRRKISKASSKLAYLRNREIATANGRGRTNINHGKINTNNINMQNVQINVPQTTRRRSKSKGRARSKSRSKSSGRLTETQGTLNKRQVRFEDYEEESSDAELDEKLADFLHELKLSQYANNFAKHKMTYNDLSEMTQQDLSYIGVFILKHQKVILKASNQKSSRDENANVDLSSKELR